jgi:hypothetical protein
LTALDAKLLELTGFLISPKNSPATAKPVAAKPKSKSAAGPMARLTSV